jgi:predicted O-methyltransferase YrrM
MIEHYWQNIHGWDDGIPPVYQSMVAQAEDGMHFVEVGAWKGRSSAFMAVEIANSGKKIQFDCIDTWEGDPNEQGHMEDEHVREGKLYEHFLDNMKPVEGYYKPVRASSTAAANLYEDNSLDFVFIDAAHDYDNVTADIAAWLPKVKEGGLIGGHDWGHPPVARAVQDSLTDIAVEYGCWFKQK